MLRQPSFAVANLMRMKCFFIGQRSVTFPHSDSSCSVLNNTREREKRAECPEKNRDDGIYSHKIITRLKSGAQILPCSTLQWRGGLCFQMSRVMRQTWIRPSAEQTPGQRERWHSNTTPLVTLKTLLSRNDLPPSYPTYSLLLSHPSTST